MELKVPDDHMVMCMHISRFQKNRTYFFGEREIGLLRGKILTKRQIKDSRSKCTQQCPEIEKKVSILSLFFHDFSQFFIKSHVLRKKDGIPFWVLALLPFHKRARTTSKPLKFGSKPCNNIEKKLA